LRNHPIQIFPQGSYHNRVNVRQDSDVDIAVRYDGIFLYTIPPGMEPAQFGITRVFDRYGAFKNDVQEALIDYFGADSVKRGNKAFDIKSNSYRVEADVAPFFLHRLFLNDGSVLSGVALRPDNAPLYGIFNWPEQHYNNAVRKNRATAKRFKGMVRILKSLRNEMEAEGFAKAIPIPGFLLECLVYNLPNDHLEGGSWEDNVRSTLDYLIKGTSYDLTCILWKEVSELKYLFAPDQKWSRQQAHAFLVAAWNYIGFE
jgi:hypothetical protein